ncbi:MAG: hypothetical protein KGJ58_02850 [Patescibacteria group bacterium]|nr:hypothetical protein [Patescibacteria group bacterium]MDE2218363.1 hypothetical protein [Patescibacteria group bacterium]
MIKEKLRKIIRKKAYSFLSKKLKPVKTEYYSSDEINKKIAHFKIKKVAILVDELVEFSLFKNLKFEKIVGFFSFNLDAIGTKIGDFEIFPLLSNSNIDTDGWIISTKNELAPFALNRYLLERKKENQIIIQHIKHLDGTRYYSYVDFFSDEQKTIIHINNYLRRLHAIPFPLDIRLTLRDCEGKIIDARQIIIPPDFIKIISSDDFHIKNFVGYLELEFEITKKISPFLHYMVDYISPDFISSNHQSGLGLHPANSAFTRGYIPTREDESLIICLFQRNYEKPVKVSAILNYFTEGEKISKEKKFKPLEKNHMLYQDIKELFNEIDFSKTESPYVVVKSDLPLHRPNYYYAKKGKRGYFDTSHAGPDLKKHVESTYGGIAEITGEEKNKLHKFGCVEMDLRHYIFPKEEKIESIMALGDDTTADIKNFTLEFYDNDGNLYHSFETEFNYEKRRYFNISSFLKDKGIDGFSGSVSFRPTRSNQKIPVSMNGVSIFSHKDKPYHTSTAASGASPDNIPFYFRAGPPSYSKIKNSVGITDIFCRGVSSEFYDTYIIISYLSANKNLRNKIRYEIEIINSFGESKSVHRKINANGTDFIRLSDLVGATNHNSENGYYAVWIFSGEANLYAQHILFRKSDNAIAVEHCYSGKFGI